MSRLLALSIPVLLLGQGGEMTLRVKPRKGATYVYSTKSSVTTTTPKGTGTPVESLIKSSMKVLETGKSIKLLSTTEDIKSEAPGASAGKGMKIVYTMSPQAQLLGAEVEGGGEVGSLMAGGLKGSLKLAPSFPEKAVKVGDTWQVAMDLKEIFGGMFGGQMTLKGDSIANLEMALTKIGSENPKTFTVDLKLAKDIVVAYGNQEIPVNWTVESTSIYDAATGMVTKQDSKQIQVLKLPDATSMTITIITTGLLVEVK